MLLVPSTSPRLHGLSTRCPAVAAAAAALALCGCAGGVKLPDTAASAPSAVKSGPQLGYAWRSQDQTLRPILGVPGSSQTGASVVAATSFVAGASSSAAALALLIGTDQQVYSMSLPNGTPAQVNLAAASGARIRFSPSGVAALVYVPGSLSASLLTNLASAPQARQISVTAPLLDMAVSDAGTVVGLLQTAVGGDLDLLPAGGSPQPLATLSGAGGLTFVGASDNLLAADSGANTLKLVRAVSTAPALSLLPTSNLLKAPVAVGTAMNGRWAVVANGGEASVVQVDLTGASSPLRIACPSQPTVVEQLAGNGVFRFTDIGNTPSWIADITNPNPSMLFIPASQ
jgi:hypothetical protein